MQSRKYVKSLIAKSDSPTKVGGLEQSKQGWRVRTVQARLEGYSSPSKVIGKQQSQQGWAVTAVSARLEGYFSTPHAWLKVFSSPTKVGGLL